MLQFVPHLQGIFGTILPAKISKNKLKMSATITTSGILCSWALEANLKWNTNVLAEWLDMDLNRKRKRKHYFQYGQVAGGGGHCHRGLCNGRMKAAAHVQLSGKEEARVESWTRTKRSSDVHVLTGLKRKLHTKCVCVAQKAPKTPQAQRQECKAGSQAGREG